MQSDIVNVYSVDIYIYTHDSTERHVEDNDMPARQSGRHDVVFGMSFFVCDVNYHAHQLDSLRFFSFLNFSYTKVALLFVYFEMNFMCRIPFSL